MKLATPGQWECKIVKAYHEALSFFFFSSLSFTCLRLCIIYVETNIERKCVSPSLRDSLIISIVLNIPNSFSISFSTARFKK